MQFNDLLAHIVENIWIVFLVVWLVSAFTAKRTASRAGGGSTLYRVLTVIILYIILRYTGVFYVLVGLYFPNMAVRIIGTLFVLLGVGLAIWARFYLGRNWGMPMTIKENAELVTTGPYRWIRHPIYAGMLLALLGATLVFGALWGIILVVYFGYFLYSVRIEDGIMAQLFPDTYPAYKARTQKIIPGVW